MVTLPITSLASALEAVTPSSCLRTTCSLFAVLLLGLVSAAHAQENTCNLGKVKERVPANYPLNLRGHVVEGTVVVLANFAADGHVTSSRVISGPSELRFESQAYINGWRADKASPDDPQRVCTIALNYVGDGSQGVCSDKRRPTVRPERIDDTHVTMHLNCDLW